MSNKLGLALVAFVACSELHEIDCFELPDGRIVSQVRVELDNKSDETRHYTLAVAQPIGLLLRSAYRWSLGPRSSRIIPLSIELGREDFVAGKLDAYIKIVETGGFHRVVKVTLLGP